LSELREWTKSRSKVVMGTPCRTAETPPTMMKSTPYSTMVRKMPKKSGEGTFIAQPRKRLDVLLQYLQAFRRCQRKHPSDESKVNTIIAISKLFILYCRGLF